mgnify:CR=1 FL=1
MSAADVSLLSRERELLMQKLNEFEKTNRVVRKLLRENKNKEVIFVGYCFQAMLIRMDVRSDHNMMMLMPMIINSYSSRTRRI